MSKTETAAKKAKESAKEAKAEKTTPATEAPVTEAKAAPAAEEAPAATEAPTAEPTAEEKTEESASEEEIAAASNFIAELFSTVVGGALPEGAAFAPEGFLFDLEFDGSDEEACGGCPENDPNFYRTVMSEVRSRANHPAYGLGLTQPKPAVALDPIHVVDETTAAFAHLVDLKKLHEVGILTEAEYNAKKTDILRTIY